MDSSNLTDYNNFLKGNSSNQAAKLSRGSSSTSSKSSSSSDSSITNINSQQDKQQQQHQYVRNYGLTTREALLRLHNDMGHEIERMRDEFSERKLTSWLKESVSFESELSKMRWPSVLFMTAQAIAHFIVAFILNIENPATEWVGFQGLILTILLVSNLAVNLWDTKLRFKELLMKSERILNLIKQCSNDKQLLKQWRQHNWTSAHAKTLFVPKSPCVHQTLTYRDESCLNLPDYLLVKGDIIHLYPGDRAPGDCMSLKAVKDFEENTTTASDKILLQEGQIFIDAKSNYEAHVQCNSQTNDKNLDDRDLIQFRHAKLKKADSGLDFLMLSTPYIRSLRVSLRSHKRPVNSVEKECFIISRKYFETFVIPSVFLLSTIVTAVHYGYLDLTDSDQKIKTISIAYLLLRPSLTIMPFLPWMFPCFWLAVNAYGSARLICCGEAQRYKSIKNGDDNHGFSPEYPGSVNNPIVSSKFENLLATPTAAGSSENKHDEDDLHDLRSDIKFTAIFKVFIDLIGGKSGHVWRSSSLLQVLGCLTSLCCIDKVGILSWSNSVPEKVFVITKTEDEESRYIVPQRHQSDEADSQNQTDENINQPMMTINSFTSETDSKSVIKMFHDDPSSNERPIIEAVKHSYGSQSRPEVLDVSQSNNCFRGFNVEAMLSQQQGRLQFDDLNWRKYISNLKPLGLGILMNNCSEQSFGDYFRFYKHITYQSILRCHTTPVMKRRCICALAKLIGFSENAVENYKYLNQIGVYQLIDASSIKPGKLVPSLENTTRLKLPFPNMVCNIYQDVTTGSQQAFTHGTADVVLDTCVEFWDGKQLVPLDEMTKKKIMDFYHRTSLTSYCSAFAYTPLLKRHRLGDHYIELPPQSSKISPQFRKLNNDHQEIFLQNQIIHLPEQPTKRSDHTQRSHSSSQENIHMSDISITAPQEHDDQVSTNRPNTITRRHLSVDDLYGIESEISQKVSNKPGGGSKKVRQLNETLDEISDQVFVGMVSLQYQACPDFVALVEQLEHACIRFVHFSKENELRSRVFSEKMGLESGWNCHISLQSDQDLDKIEQVEDCRPMTDIDAKYREDASKSTAFLPNKRISSILGGHSNEFRSNKKDDDRSSISSDERTLYSWKSLPSLVMKLTAKLSAIASHHHRSMPDHYTSNKGLKTNYQSDHVGDSLQPESEFGDDVAAEQNEGSIKDEGFESLAFDMSNRAKLPKGIENIRPHLETVDNVPLQVSLFTDCTPELTQEMIEIMQEYGEIVCVIGSSASRLNTPVFLQANASIAIEPLVPLSCTREEVNLQKSLDRKSRKIKRHEGKLARKSKRKNEREEESEFTVINMNPRPNNPRDRLGIGPTEPVKLARAKPQRQTSLSSSSSSSSSSSRSPSSSSSSSPETDCNIDDIDNVDGDLLENDPKVSSLLLKEFPGPNSLASKLASLPCSYSYSRKDPVNLYSLIMEARHFTFKMKNTFVCMICFALSISSAQFLASILFLPPMLSSGLTIWLTVVVVPLMSFSLMSTTIDSQVMKIAVGKNLQLKPENITFFVICYLIKFIPSIIVVVLSFGLIIAHSCKLTGFGSSSLGPCWMFTYVQHGNNATSSDTGDEDLVWSTHLLTAQVCAAFLLVLYFVVISAGFVHRSHLIWQKSPTKNRFWVLISLVLIFGQLVYNHLVLHVNLSSSRISYEFLVSLPLHIWIISFISPVLVTGINLLVKRAEIKATIRQQRRARFDFNTKLGMNSPF